MNVEITHSIIHIVVLVTTQLSNIEKSKMENCYEGIDPCLTLLPTV